MCIKNNCLNTSYNLLLRRSRDIQETLLASNPKIYHPAKNQKQIIKHRFTASED
jgi:hypothetical protein